MNIRSTLIASCTVCAFLIAGCSGSDEAKKEQKQGAPGEFGTVRSDSVAAPKTMTPSDAAQKEKELPQTEKEAPGKVPEPAQTTTPPAPTQTPPAPGTPAGGQKSATGLAMWSVQIGAFKSEAGATQCANDARGKFNQPIYKDYDPVTGFYKVTVGSFSAYDQAGKYKLEVQAKGYPDAFPVEVKR